jgi:hypothetical protein
VVNKLVAKTVQLPCFEAEIRTCSKGWEFNTAPTHAFSFIDMYFESQKYIQVELLW